MDVGRKRLLLIAGFIAVVLLLAYGLYFFFFRRPTTEQIATPPGTQVPGQLPSGGVAGSRPTSTAGTGPGSLPQAGGVVPQLGQLPGTPSPSRVSVLRDEVTSEVSSSPEGGVRAYNPLDGRFYRIRDDGTTELLSDEVFYNVDQVDWANRSDKAILTYPDGSNVYYDFGSDRQTTLPKHWEDFAFSPQDEKIVAKSLGNSESNRFLVIANPDGTGAQAVEDLGDNQDKVTPNWSPNNQVIAFSNTGEALGYDRQSVLLVGQNHENFKALVVEGRGFIPKWSPTGASLLYSVHSSSNGYRPTLWVSAASGDTVGEGRRNLQLQTWADKCVWQSDNVLYCAVPTQLGEGAGLQRELFSTVPDAIYRIDLGTGQAVSLGVPEGNPAIRDLLVSQDGRALYFTDRATGNLIRFGL